MTGAVRDASLAAHHQSLSSLLGSPISVGSSTGATAIMPSVLTVNGPRPEIARHPQAQVYAGGRVESSQAMPYATPEGLNLGSVTEVVFVLVVVLVLACRLYMWVVDETGKVLARVNPLP